MMTTTTHDNLLGVEISGLEMYCMSPEDIRVLSAAEITVPNCNIEDRVAGSLYDARLGASSSGGVCATCDTKGDGCMGHMGHLELAVPVVNPLMYALTHKHAVEVLRLFCWRRGHLKLSAETKRSLENASQAVKDDARKKFAKICSTKKKCAECAATVCEECEVLRCAKCSSAKERCKKCVSKRKCVLCKDPPKAPMPALNGAAILRFFENLSQRDLDLVGYGGKKHPRRFVWTAFPIIGSVARPVIKMAGDVSSDDITKKYSSIVRDNADLRAALLLRAAQAPPKKGKNADDLLRALESTIHSMIINNNNIRKIFGRDNGKAPCLSFKDRISSKQGRLRNNLMGKRVDFSARSVISPDPSLSVGEVGLPAKFARILTVPEIVREYNRRPLEILVNEGKAKFFIRDGRRKCIEPLLKPKGGYRFRKGDVVLRGGRTLDPRDAVPLVKGDAVRHGNGEELRDPDLPSQRWITLELGDTVERHYRDGDRLIVNRQPTLHSAGMMSHRVRVMQTDTIKLNLAVCSAYNADFDGDEMNLHAPQTQEARAEMDVMSVENHFLSELNGMPIIYPIQDTHLGWYDLTREGGRTLSVAEWSFVVADAFHGCGVSDAQLARAAGAPGGVRSGHGLFSMLLPGDFCYDRELTIAGDPVRVRIVHGVLLEGVVQKALIGGGGTSVLGLLAREYSRKLAMDVVDRLQWIARAWLTMHPCSLGPSDFFPSAKTTALVNKSVDATLMDAWKVECGGGEEADVEAEVANILNSARDVGQKIAKEAMGSKNVLRTLVDSGAKGNYVNVAQIVGLVGQQCVAAARIEKSVSNGSRCLTSFPAESELRRLAAQHPEVYMPLLYQSRGFVASSFATGLNPSEYFFHAQGGRKGLSDTAVKTRDSGYIQRRIVKTSEDLRAEHDGTVRDSVGNVVQFSYGHRGLDTAESVREGRAFVDIERLAARMSPRGHDRGETLTLAALSEHLTELTGSADEARLEIAQWRGARDLVVNSRRAFLDEVSRRYHVSLVCPGKSVGVIMAQSVGEPTTQMVLNTFHLAGVANKKSNMGLRKVKDLTELIDTTRRVCTVKMLPGVSRERVAGALVRTALADIMIEFRKVLRGSSSDEPWWYAVCLADDPGLFGSSAEGDAKSMLGMRVVLDGDVLSSRGMVPRDVVTALRRGHGNPLTEAVLIASPGCVPGVDPCVDIYVHPDILLTADAATVMSECSMETREWHGYVSVVLQAMHRVTICGLPGVRDSAVDAEDPSVMNLDGSGMDMMSAYHGVYLDFYHTWSDNPKEMAAVLGVEAGRRVLLESLKTVIEFDGTKIAPAHLELLTDNVSFYGALLPMTRSGIKSMDASLFSKMSFEETPAHVAEGAARNVTDPVQGVSARIVAGLPIRMGTGFCDLLPCALEEEHHKPAEYEDDEDLEF